jgi:hypothetical protein
LAVSAAPLAPEDAFCDALRAVLRARVPVLEARERVLLPLRLDPPRLLLERPLLERLLLERLLPLLPLLPELLARLLPLLPELFVRLLPLLRLLLLELLPRLLLARPFELADRELDDLELPDRDEDDLLFVVPPPERFLVPALSGDITLLPGK